jgi:hypothetical protein
MIDSIAARNQMTAGVFSSKRPLAGLIAAPMRLLRSTGKIGQN